MRKKTAENPEFDIEFCPFSSLSPATHEATDRFLPNFSFSFERKEEEIYVLCHLLFFFSEKEKGKEPNFQDYKDDNNPGCWNPWTYSPDRWFSNKGKGTICQYVQGFSFLS